MFTVFFLVVLLVLILGFLFVGFRLIIPLHLTAPWNILAWLGVLGSILLPFSYSLFGRMAEGDWTEIVAWVAYSALGFLSFVVTFLLMRDLLWFAVLGANKAASLLHIEPFLTDSLRGAMLKISGWAVLVLSLLATPYGIWQARSAPVLNEITVSLPNLPAEFEGARIVQISDLHAGLTIRRDWFEDLVVRVNALHPDLIAFTGDLADGRVSALGRDTEPLARLRAPLGKYFVTGNHEYYSGAAEWTAEVRRLGFVVLDNEHRVLGSDSAALVIAGVTDHSAGSFDPSMASHPAKALQGVPENAPLLLLAHQPRVLSLPGGDRAHLVLTGHTHGGQFFPWNFFARLGQPAIAGLHRFGHTLLYVHRGTGYWGPPVRLGAPAEIAVFTLTRE